MSYVYIRVRNSPAGRVKPIKMKCFNKSQEESTSWDLNFDFRKVKDLYNNFLKELYLPFISSTLNIQKGVYKGWNVLYIQAYITDKKAPEYDNAYKTKEEVAKYLCKYYWSYTAEESFIRQVKRRNEIIHDEGRNLNAIWKDEKMQEYILKIAGIIDISEEIRKYNETKKTNFHESIYNLFCKYLENPNFIDEAINNNPEAKGMRTVKEFAAEILNYRYGLNCY